MPRFSPLKPKEVEKSSS